MLPKTLKLEVSKQDWLNAHEELSGSENADYCSGCLLASAIWRNFADMMDIYTVSVVYWALPLKDGFHGVSVIDEYGNDAYYELDALGKNAYETYDVLTGTGEIYRLHEPDMPDMELFTGVSGIEFPFTITLTRRDI